MNSENNGLVEHLDEGTVISYLHWVVVVIELSVRWSEETFDFKMVCFVLKEHILSNLVM